MNTCNKADGTVCNKTYRVPIKMTDNRHNHYIDASLRFHVKVVIFDLKPFITIFSSFNDVTYIQSDKDESSSKGLKTDLRY